MRIEGSNAMKSVKIEQKKLLEVLKENRSKHESDFNKSVDGYEKEIIEVSEKNVKLAKKVASLVKEGSLTEASQIRFEPLPQRPKSYLDHYNRAIRMVELSADEIIELESEVFNQLVMDEWNWKLSFVTSNQKYLG